MDITMAVLADAANVTGDGKVNILGIFRNLYAVTAPARHQQLSLVVCIEANPAEKGRTYQLEAVMMSVDGKQLATFPPYEFTVPTVPVPLNPDFTLILTIGGLLLPAFGDYVFTLLIDKQAKRTIPLSLSPVPQPPLPTHEET